MQVLAQEHVKAILARRAQTDEQTALPSITFDEERKIGLGGVTVQLLHLGPGHNSGDAVVYFPDLKVVAVGDLYTSTMPDAADWQGSLEVWEAELRKILQLDFDTVLPGTGPIIKRGELEALANRIDELLAARDPLSCESVSASPGNYRPAQDLENQSLCGVHPALPR